LVIDNLRRIMEKLMGILIEKKLRLMMMRMNNIVYLSQR